MKASSSWWLEPAHCNAAWDAFSSVWTRDSERREMLRRHARLYGNQDLSGLGRGVDIISRSKDRLTLNVIKSVVDTVVARIGKQRPRPRFLTTAGNASLRRKSRLLERWTDAQFYTTGVYTSAPKAILDAAITGAGFLKVYREGDRLCVERVWPGEVCIDSGDGLYAAPRSLFQTKFVNREVLSALFPWHKELIDRAARCDPSAEEDTVSVDGALIDQVQVVEAWHLPSKPGAADGKHVIAIKEGQLSEETYSRDCFPIAMVSWSEPIRGFWGQGLAEELTGIQIEINRLLQKIQKGMHLMAVPQVWVEQQSKVKTSQISNQMAAIYHYTGQAPKFITPPAMHPEVYQHLWQLYSRAFEIAGISRLSSQSIRPSGLESAPALREYHDIESERFALRSASYESLFMQVTERLLDEGRALARDNPAYSVVAQKDRWTIQEVKWSEVDMERDSYVIRVFPSSSLPTTPSSRLAFVQDLLQLQLVAPDVAKRLLDFPDLDAEMSLDRAVSDNVDAAVESMLDDGRYVPPEPFIDLVLALKRVQMHYNKAQTDGVPEERLRLLRRYMAAVDLLRTRAATQMPGAMPVAGIPPAAGPMGQPPMAVTPQDGFVT